MLQKDYAIAVASLVLFFSLIPILILVSNIVKYRSGSSDQGEHPSLEMAPHIKSALERHERLHTDPFSGDPELKKAFLHEFNEEFPEFNWEEYKNMLVKEREKFLAIEAKEKHEEAEKEEFRKMIETDTKKAFLTLIELQDKWGILINQFVSNNIPHDELNEARVRCLSRVLIMENECSKSKANKTWGPLFQAISAATKFPISRELSEAIPTLPQTNLILAPSFIIKPDPKTINQAIQNLLEKLYERFPNDVDFYQSLLKLLPISEEARKEFLDKVFPKDYFLSNLLRLLEIQNGLPKLLSQIKTSNEKIDELKAQIAAYNSSSSALRETALRMMKVKGGDAMITRGEFYCSIARATLIPLGGELVHFLFHTPITKEILSVLSNGPLLLNGKIEFVNPDSTIALLLDSLHNCLLEKTLDFSDDLIKKVIEQFAPDSLPHPRAFTSVKRKKGSFPYKEKFKIDFIYSFDVPEPKPEFTEFVNDFAFDGKTPIEIPIKSDKVEIPNPTEDDLFKPYIDSISAEGLKFLFHVANFIYPEYVHVCDSKSGQKPFKYDQFESKLLGVPGAMQLLFQRDIHGFRSFEETQTNEGRFFMPTVNIDPRTMRLMAKFHSLQLANGVGITTRFQAQLFKLGRTLYINNNYLNRDAFINQYRYFMGIPMLAFDGTVLGGSEVSVPKELLGDNFNHLTLRAAQMCIATRLISGFDAYINFLNCVYEKDDVIKGGLFTRFDTNLVNSSIFFNEKQKLSTNYFSSNAFDIKSTKWIK